MAEVESAWGGGEARPLYVGSEPANRAWLVVVDRLEDSQCVSTEGLAWEIVRALVTEGCLPA